jgi:flavin reductase (DIM6/NTAB) family NADH-FMN oxidoreductase RutF
MARSKIDIGPQGFVYPMPMTLVGADLPEHPSFMPIAWLNRVQFNPPRLAAGLGKVHATNRGIRENREFSVCFPTESMVAAVDWCGLNSSRNIDKSLEFEVFRGSLEHAPMIAECPLCLECRVIEVVDLGSHELFIADIEATWTEDHYLDEAGKPDIEAIKPFMLTMPDNRYWRVGEQLAEAWSVGHEYVPTGEG